MGVDKGHCTEGIRTGSLSNRPLEKSSKSRGKHRRREGERGWDTERERVGGGTFEGQSGGHPIGTVSISFFRHPPPPHLASAH